MTSTDGRVHTFYAEGTRFLFEDPDFSVARDCVPGQPYEPTVTSLLSDALQAPGAVFADIGALYGYFSCWAGKHVPTVPIFAFEPEQAWTAVMTRNIALNGVQVSIEQIALTDTNGPVSFHDRTVEPVGPQAKFVRNYPRASINWLKNSLNADPARQVTSGHTDPAFSGWEVIRRTRQVASAKKRRPPAVDSTHSVDGMTLDSWVLGRTTLPTVLKIDVHGGEGLVLRGAQQSMEKVQDILLELHTPDYLVDTNYEEILGLLMDANFSLFELRGFRRRQGKLIELDSQRRRALCDIRTWTPEDLYYMRFLYATRR